MPAPARKAPAKKAPTPAEAAVAEALGENDIELEFRGEKFVILDDTRRSFKYAMAVASGFEPQMIYEMIQEKDRARFIRTAKSGESYMDVAVEFFDALNEASGQGNS